MTDNKQADLPDEKIVFGTINPNKKSRLNCAVTGFQLFKVVFRTW
jgi:hypothetical protein